MDDFVPPGWTREMLYLFAASIVTPTRGYNGPPPYLIERVPRTAEWLAGRVEYAIRLTRLVAEGLEQGWLEQTPCYECGGELVITEDTEEVRRHPNPDYKPLDLPPGDSITIPKAN